MESQKKIEKLVFQLKNRPDYSTATQIIPKLWSHLNSLNQSEQISSLDECYYYLISAEHEMDLSTQTIRDHIAFQFSLDLFQIQLNSTHCNPISPLFV